MIRKVIFFEFECDNCFDDYKEEDQTGWFHSDWQQKILAIKHARSEGWKISNNLKIIICPDCKNTKLIKWI